jgi:serine/threonine-protein kinase SRPK3
LLIEIGDVEQIVKRVVKTDPTDKENNRNGRRRRRTLITGSQPLPSPLNNSFNHSNLFPSVTSTASLTQMLHEGMCRYLLAGNTMSWGLRGFGKLTGDL